MWWKEREDSGLEQEELGLKSSLFRWSSSSCSSVKEEGEETMEASEIMKLCGESYMVFLVVFLLLCNGLLSIITKLSRSFLHSSRASSRSFIVFSRSSCTSHSLLSRSFSPAFAASSSMDAHISLNCRSSLLCKNGNTEDQFYTELKASEVANSIRSKKQAWYKGFFFFDPSIHGIK